MMTDVKDLKELPVTLNVEQVANILSVSRSIAYEIVKTEGLAVRVGVKRLIIPRDRLINYLQSA